MVFLKNIENQLINEFIIPIINDEECFNFIYQEFATHKRITSLGKWLYFKYLFEYTGDNMITASNPEAFSKYLVELFFSISTQPKAKANEQNQTNTPLQL